MRTCVGCGLSRKRDCDPILVDRERSEENLESSNESIKTKTNKTKTRKRKEKNAKKQVPKMKSVKQRRSGNP